MTRSLFFLIIVLVIWSCVQPKKKPVIEEVSLQGTTELDVPKKLSKWGLFEQPIHQLHPVEGILPYDLNTPLFTDYALKARFLKLPEGKAATYDSAEVMNFPLGTILIKNFFYQNDLTDSDSEYRIIETRLLINEEQGWNALTYVWNEEQTEAVLEISGAAVAVSWKDEKGVIKQVNYSVPNLVQCKSCHEKSGKMSPIGPSARQLNKSFTYNSGIMNQLDKWAALGMLENLPDLSQIPKLPVWDDPNTGSLDKRARAWLEINCAHCHRREGPAKNSGLYLMYSQNDPYKLGINKPPIAAGRGSGGMKYAIVPGNPDKSILVHRIQSLDPGVMMPELGRKMRHEEGIALIRDWISQMH